jgi:EAL domain-containing protein (putative c-di-GMP-specific phosphodiesterase class I)/GGDEF domain-containing protein
MYIGGETMDLLETNYREQLAETMKRLGNNTSKCYLLVDAMDPSYPIIFSNEAYTHLTGFRENELYLKPFNSLFSFLSNEQFNTIEETIAKGEIARVEAYHLRHEGYYFHARIECFPLLNDELKPEFIYVMVSDITYTSILKEATKLEQRIFRAIEKDKTFFDKMTLTCQFIDETLGPDVFSTIFTTINNEFYITSAVEFEQSNTHLIPKGMAQNYYKFLMQLTDSKVYARHKGYALSKQHQQYAEEKELLSCWQIPIPIHGKGVVGVITLFFKTQRRPREFYNQIITKIINLIGLSYTYEMKQQEIYRLAYTDLATGLPNRHDFVRKLKENFTGATLFIRPSEYSKFVELYGRKFGDELVKQIAVKLSRIHFIDFIAQFSSSTLAIHIAAEEEAQRNFIKLFERIGKEALNVFGNSIYVTLKVGVALCEQEMNADRVCKNAESALAVANPKSGTFIAYYNEEIQENLKKELLILNELVEAIRNKEFQAYVQPKVETYRGRIYGMEALARWQSPKLGFVSPGDFIPVAESAGLIREIDLQIFEQVLIWMQQRQYNGKRIVPVAVNISPEHFYHPKFISGLTQLMNKYYADPKYIIIEVTESISLVDVTRAQKILLQLRLLGFGTSVDDFGIGYSSLTYLQKLPFNELKIDQSFITRIHEAGTHTIVQSILTIAHNLEMTSVAEGIENEQQYNLMKRLGCNIAQGYYLYRPIDLKKVDDLALF